MNDRKSARRWLRRLAGRRGQAMVSYAIITAALLGTGLVLSVKFAPKLMNAINAYSASIYFGINLPWP